MHEKLNSHFCTPYLVPLFCIEVTGHVHFKQCDYLRLILDIMAFVDQHSLLMIRNEMMFRELHFPQPASRYASAFGKSIYLRGD